RSLSRAIPESVGIRRDTPRAEDEGENASGLDSVWRGQRPRASTGPAAPSPRISTRCVVFAVETFGRVDRSAQPMGKYLKISPPKRGSKITVAKNGQLQVPDDPIVPYIQGEGITNEVWRSTQAVFDIAVERCYANAKRIEWLEVYAGERGNEVYGA